jgi:hypothetical protein
MKFNITKILLSSFVFFAISLFALSIFSFPGGYIGTTKKNGGDLGCVCHGEHTPSSEVSVFFAGPDSVAVGDTVTFTVKMAHGPAETGGFNVAASIGGLDTILGMGTRKEAGELTHSSPKAFTNDTVSWTFKYIAPNTAQIDTLFATGNSTNNDLTSDSDMYNFSNNRPVKVYNPIGIINISTVAKDFSLSQNYPNPFNPSTQIEFTVGKGSLIMIKVFDVTGRQVDIIVNQNLTPGKYKADFNSLQLSSGVYFYSMFSGSERLFTRKMLLVK